MPNINYEPFNIIPTGGATGYSLVKETDTSFDMIWSGVSGTGGGGGGDALVADPLSQFAATTSAQLAGVITDETGSGNLVFSMSPTLVTPTLGVASATSVNKITFTAPATGATITVADGKTLTVSDDANVSGANTGDQSNWAIISGNVGSTTANSTTDIAYLLAGSGGGRTRVVSDSLFIDGLIPSGGAINYVLKKNSADDYDYSWQVDSSGTAQTPWLQDIDANNFNLRTASVSGSANSNHLEITTGSVVDGGSGNLTVATGLASGLGTRGELTLGGSTLNFHLSPTGDIKYNNGGLLYFRLPTTGDDGKVFTFEESTGEMLWQTPSGGSQSPWVADIESAGFDIMDDAATPIISISPSGRILYEAAGVVVLDWGNRYLKAASNTIAIDWNSRILADSSEVSSVSWNDRKLYQTDGTTVALDWSSFNFATLLNTANKTGSDTSDSISITTGTTVDGNSGDITLTTGLPSGIGVRGGVVTNNVIHEYDIGTTTCTVYAASHLIIKSFSGDLKLGLEGDSVYVANFKIPVSDGVANQALVTDGSRQLKFSSQLSKKVVPLSINTGLVATDCETTDIATLELTENASISAPSGTPITRQLLEYNISQDGTGGWTVTWDSTFRFSITTPSPTWPTTASKMGRILFEWNEVASKWDCLSYNFGY